MFDIYKSLNNKDFINEFVLVSVMLLCKCIKQ